jgi:alginate O-acetyltransferase complex protein AlgI
MLFPTIEFGIFFLIVFTVSWAVRWTPGSRKLVLLGASYFFYGWWDWRFTALLFVSTLINFLAGLALERATGQKLRKFIVGVAVVAGLGILGFFKYYDFFLTSFAVVLEGLGLERDLPFMQVILPVGISFFTFQGISYVVDVYRGHVKAERSLSNVMLYISFFPQLVAGPIVRAADFLPQLHKAPALTRAHVGVGVVRIRSGLVKKILVAN